MLFLNSRIMGLNNNNKINNTTGQNHDNTISSAKYHEKPHVWALYCLEECAIGYAPKRITAPRAATESTHLNHCFPAYLRTEPSAPLRTLD